MAASLKVLFVTPECSPFAKTGGLADVAGALPKALAGRGIDVRVVMPLYAGVDWNSLEVLEGTVVVPMGRGRGYTGIRMGHLPGSRVPVYFLEHHHYFDRPHLYGPPKEAYGDNLERFAFLSRGSLELCKALGWIPDIVHANDWQTALVPAFLNTVEWAQSLHGAASIYTIHNLAYQGVFDGGALWVTGLGWEHYKPEEFEHFGALNLTKGAIVHSTLLSTVSPTYAREIQTPVFGYGLDGLLAGRGGDLVGLLNGIDVHEWDPATDPHITAPYSPLAMEGKAACKRALQEEAGFPVRPEVPVFGLVSRLTSQKGIDVLARAMEGLLHLDLQFVLLGAGDPDAEAYLRRLGSQRGDRFRAWLHFDNRRAHRIEAGCDFFVMPSRYEPCGLNQLYSLRYGTLPIVRATGGLADTVINYDEHTGRGTGFVFHDLNPGAVYNTVGWALATWYDRPRHIAEMRRQAMVQDFSWEHSAAEYEQLYLRAYERRRGHPFAGR